jgi:hypothetical protein
LNGGECGVKSVGQSWQRNCDGALIETDNGLADANIQKDETQSPSGFFCIVGLHLQPGFCSSKRHRD